MYETIPATSRFVVDWCYRMAVQYGGTVYDKDGKWYDWGQALMREQYGKEWYKLNLIDPTHDDVERAKEWELGKIPSWVDQERWEVSFWMRRRIKR